MGFEYRFDFNSPGLVTFEAKLMNTCFIVAEAGVNHNGSEELAMQLVEAAAKAGADAVKFQTFKADSLVAKGTAAAEYQQQHTGCSDQFEMLKKLELADDLYQKIIDFCDTCNIEFMSTAFDLDAARFLLSLGMQRLKVPSGELTNLPFIRELAALDKPMILSTGMANLAEVNDAVVTIRAVRKEYGFPDPLEEVVSILHCTSNYPARREDVNLKAMQTMASKFELPVGYSDHTDGTLVSVAAVAMGAMIIEKHFTMDKKLPGPDHQASLEPESLKLMIQQIRQIEVCIGDGRKQPCESELPVRDLVRRSVALLSDKEDGDILSVEDLILLRPGTGIQPKKLEQLIGRQLKVAKKAGTLLDWMDLK